MRIISGHIDNFGKLSDFSFEFLPGLNIINQVNGWGKTTFAAYLKAMFFGMEYNRSKKTMTDRTRYYPWNNGSFGGSLVFEVQGRAYRVVRSFGKKENEDTFVIYDLSKNLETRDFSENLGEEIFKVDRDSFEKTAFITLNDFELLNDIISGKLGNIDEQESDMEASSKAVSTIEANLNKLDPKRSAGPGSIREKKEQLEELKEELEACYVAREELSKKLKVVELGKQEREKLNNLIEAADEEQMKLSFASKQKVLFNLKQSFDEAVCRYQESHDFFGGQVPTEKEVQELEEAVSDYNKAVHRVQEYALDQSEMNEYAVLSNTFSMYVPTQEELQMYGSAVMDIAIMENQLSHTGLSAAELSRYNELDKIYNPILARDINVDELINDYMGATELEKRAELYASEIDKLNDQPVAAKRNYIPYIILNVLLMVAGAVLAFVQESFIVGFACILAGILGVPYCIYNMKRQEKIPTVYEVLGVHTHEELMVQLEATIKTRDELKLKYMHVLGVLGISTEDIMNTLLTMKSEVQEYRRLSVAGEIAIQNNSELIEELDAKQAHVDRFLSEYIDMTEIISRRVALDGLVAIIHKYRILNDKQMQCNHLMQECGEWERNVSVKFSRFFPQMPEKPSEALEMIKINMAMLQERREDVDKHKAKYDDFAKENDVELLNSLAVNLDDSEEYQLEMRSKKAEHVALREELVAMLMTMEKEMEQLTTKSDCLVDIETAVEHIVEEINAMEHEADILKITKDCMIRAKESLAEKYMGSITQAFEKFRGTIEQGELEKYHIDIGLNVKVEHDGLLHPSEVLSTGKNDLMQVCMRLALVEAVYKGVEMPPLILDDPFVNLDNYKLDNATRLLENLGQQQQLIYFVCHTSRVI